MPSIWPIILNQKLPLKKYHFTESNRIMPKKTLFPFKVPCSWLIACRPFPALRLIFLATPDIRKGGCGPSGARVPPCVFPTWWEVSCWQLWLYLLGGNFAERGESGGALGRV